MSTTLCHAPCIEVLPIYYLTFQNPPFHCFLVLYFKHTADIISLLIFNYLRPLKKQKKKHKKLKLNHFKIAQVIKFTANRKTWKTKGKKFANTNRARHLHLSTAVNVHFALRILFHALLFSSSLLSLLLDFFTISKHSHIQTPATLPLQFAEIVIISSYFFEQHVYLCTFLWRFKCRIIELLCRKIICTYLCIIYIYSYIPISPAAAVL